MESPSLSMMINVALALIAALILSKAIDVVYKFCLHPLAGFPGPWAACISPRWVHQVSRKGNAEQVFEELHQKYASSAIRIAPNELHLDKTSLYKTIYSQTSRFKKDPQFYSGFGTPHTVFAETDPVLHKERRRILSPFFSRSAITNMEPIIKEKIAELGERLDSQTGPINVYNAVRCTTVDIISHYCMGQPLNQLRSSDTDFHGSFLVAFDSVASIFWDMLYSPVLRLLATSIPERLAMAISKDAASVLSLRRTCYNAALAQKKSKADGQSNVFSALSHISDDDRTDEAVDLLIAGSDTTAFSLTTAIVEIAGHESIKNKLVKALQDEVDNPDYLPSLLKLESIQFLNACVREAIRHASPVPGRLPRVVPPDAALVIDGKFIPPGSIVGMSAYTTHRDKVLWGDDAGNFNPDRWLDGNSKSLDQHMVSFSKGLRSCLGQNLAYAEVHFLLAYLFRKYDISLANEKSTANKRDAFTYYLAEHRLMVNLPLRKA